MVFNLNPAMLALATALIILIVVLFLAMRSLLYIAKSLSRVAAQNGVIEKGGLVGLLPVVKGRGLLAILTRFFLKVMIARVR